jgi:hypothetical protein
MKKKKKKKKQIAPGRSQGSGKGYNAVLLFTWYSLGPQSLGLDSRMNVSHTAKSTAN